MFVLCHLQIWYILAKSHVTVFILTLALYVPHLQCWDLASHQSSGWLAVLECISIYVKTEVVLEFLE